MPIREGDEPEADVPVPFSQRCNQCQHETMSLLFAALLDISIGENLQSRQANFIKHAEAALTRSAWRLD